MHKSSVYATPDPRALPLDTLVHLDHPTAAADLSFLSTDSQLPRISHIAFCFDLHKDHTVGVQIQPLLAALSPLPGVTQCTFQGMGPTELWPLLQAFPDVEDLSLEFFEDLSDVELFGLTACAPNLARLTLTYCRDPTPTGIVALCLRLDGLEYIK